MRRDQGRVAGCLAPDSQKSTAALSASKPKFIISPRHELLHTLCFFNAQMLFKNNQENKMPSSCNLNINTTKYKHNVYKFILLSKVYSFSVGVHWTDQKGEADNEVVCFVTASGSSVEEGIPGLTSSPALNSFSFQRCSRETIRGRIECWCDSVARVRTVLNDTLSLRSGYSQKVINPNNPDYVSGDSN